MTNTDTLNLDDWQPPADLLAERVILVTGAANGIGRALADSMAAHGATLVLLDKDVKGLELAYDEIVAAGQPEPALYPMDLQGAAPDDYAQMADTLAGEFGRLDGLVQNAAWLGALVPLANYDNDMWLQSLQVNLHAPYLMTTACMDLLTASSDASVIFVSDSVGRHGKAYWGAYSVAKAGIENLMQVFADEMENSTVRFNTIDTGPVLTGMRRIAYPGEQGSTLAKPADIAQPFLYLCSRESRGINGQQLTID